MDEITQTTNNNYKSIRQLLDVIRTDPLVHEEVGKLLKLDAYHRRIMLNDWLEQLRRRRASERLLHALACLFDDHIAAQVLEFIDDS